MCGRISAFLKRIWPTAFSRRNEGQPSSSQTTSTDDNEQYDLPQGYGCLTEIAAPPPVEKRDQAALARHSSLEQSQSHPERYSSSDYDMPDSYSHLSEIAAPPPVDTDDSHQAASYPSLESSLTRSRESSKKRRRNSSKSSRGSKQRNSLSLA